MKFDIMGLDRTYIEDGKIWQDRHEGREGWTPTLLWEPTAPSVSSDITLSRLIRQAQDEARAEQSRLIGSLLGVLR